MFPSAGGRWARMEQWESQREGLYEGWQLFLSEAFHLYCGGGYFFFFNQSTEVLVDGECCINANFIRLCRLGSGESQFPEQETTTWEWGDEWALWANSAPLGPCSPCSALNSRWDSCARAYSRDGTVPLELSQPWCGSYLWDCLWEWKGMAQQLWPRGRSTGVQHRAATSPCPLQSSLQMLINPT